MSSTLEDLRNTRLPYLYVIESSVHKVEQEKEFIGDLIEVPQTATGYRDSDICRFRTIPSECHMITHNGKLVRVLPIPLEEIVSIKRI